MVRLAIIIGKLVTLLSKSLNLGNGGTWPGEIALYLDPGILPKLVPSGAKIILIAGTNGKTTTAKLLRTILKAQGAVVIQNDSGANLTNGAVASLINSSSWFGKIRADYLVLEADEATLPTLLKDLDPDLVILLNLFRDQLDRYGEVDSLAKKWLAALSGLSISKTRLVINGDDPFLVWIAGKVNLESRFFGLSDKNLFLPKMQHATDSIYCPQCGRRLDFKGFYFSHLGQWSCQNCGLNQPRIDLNNADLHGVTSTSLEGVYNRYNFLAAILSAKLLDIDVRQIKVALADFQPAFGRQEEIFSDGKKIKLLLSKNPAGFNESLRTAISSGHRDPLLLVLNDRIPDGTDVSWIWDVDVAELAKYRGDLLASGDRAFDLALRLKYAGLKNYHLEPNLKEAVVQGIESVPPKGKLWILPTYSSMLEVRQILLGRKIL